MNSHPATSSHEPRHPLGDFLRQVEPLSNVRAEWLDLLAALVAKVEFDPDETLFRAGDAADAVYIVRSGQVAMFTDSRGKPVRLVTRIGPRELLGIVDTLGGSQRVTSARAVTRTRLLRLSRSNLLRLTDQDSDLGLRFTLALVSRHARNAAGALELGNRREIRICVDREVELVAGPGKRVRARLHNLSRGGICFGGASGSRFPDVPTSYTVRGLDGDLVLRFHARVAWRQGTRTGLAFAEKAPAHDLLIQGALRQLLRTPKPDDAEDLSGAHLPADAVS